MQTMMLEAPTTTLATATTLTAMQRTMLETPTTMTTLATATTSALQCRQRC